MTDVGRVAVFYGAAGGLTTTPAFEVTGQAASEFGMALDGGDVNGDAFSDLVVGAPMAANGEAEEGQVTVYYGSGTGLSTSGATTLEMNQAGAHFGHSVAAGDTNGDGPADVVVGAPHYANGETNEGAAFVFLGAAAGVATTPSWTFECDQADAMCGEAVAAGGDLNNDGVDDVLVGAPGYSVGGLAVGRVFAFLGSTGGLATTFTSVDGAAAGQEFGGSVAFAGDVNGDGYDDVLVGAVGMPPVALSPNVTGGGSAFLYYGGPSGLSATPAWNAEGNAEGDQFGASLAGGDFDNDGYADLAIGAPGLYAGQQPNTGGVYVFAGQADVTPTPTATRTPAACIGTATPHPTSSVPGPTSGLLERQIANCYDDAHERTDVGVVYPLLDTVTTGGTTDWRPIQRRLPLPQHRHSGRLAGRLGHAAARRPVPERRARAAHASGRRRGQRRGLLRRVPGNQQPAAHLVGRQLDPD